MLVFFVFLSIYPTLFMKNNSPPGYSYTFIHNSISDYPYYISFIRQGTYGRLKAIDQFTHEVQTEGYYHVFYVWLGRFGGILNLDPKIIYFYARIFLGGLFLLVSYRFIRLFFIEKKDRLWTFLIFIISSSWPKLVLTEKGFDIWQYLYWWTESDALRRITFIPHFLIGHIGLITAVFLLIKLLKNFSYKYFFLMLLVGFFTGIFHPPSLGMIYYIFFMYLSISLMIFLFHKIMLIFPSPNYYLLISKKLSFRLNFMTNKNPNILKKIFILKKFSLIVAFFILSVPSLIYIYYLTGYVFPWTLMKAQESLFYAIDIKEYLLSIGPVLILGILGIIFLTVRKKLIISKYLLIFIWSLLPIIMIPVSEYIHYSKLNNFIPTFANIRFLSMVIQLPLSISAMSLLIIIRKKYSRRLYYFLIFLFIALSFPVLSLSLKSQLNDFAQSNQFRYVSRSIIDAFQYMDQTGSENTLVLTGHDNSLLLPLFSKNRVYAGQSIYTFDNPKKENLANEFFQGKMNKCQSLEFIKDNGIDYIFSSYDDVNSRLKNLPFLKAERFNDNTRVFKFIYNFQDIKCN
jgi:hypothetical protein